MDTVHSGHSGRKRCSGYSGCTECRKGGGDSAISEKKAPPLVQKGHAVKQMPMQYTALSSLQWTQYTVDAVCSGSSTQWMQCPSSYLCVILTQPDIFYL